MNSESIFKVLLPLAASALLPSCSDDGISRNDVGRVREFIASHWDATIRENTADDGTLIGLPYPYTVPCAADTFQEMYYWDTFFTNEGLILDGRVEQARNNVENVMALVERFGFMPNGSRTWYLNRSQPPFLAPMVAAVYRATGDGEWFLKACRTVEKEYAFWATERMTPCGLNRYSSSADEALRKEFVQTGSQRLGYDFSAEATSAEDTHRIGGHFAAEAESGWDFNPRFERRCEDFCPVDLNANLYFYETLLAECAALRGDGEAVEKWRKAAAERKELMERLMRGEDGLYYDYDFVNGCRSTVVSGAIFSLLCARILSDEEAAAIVPQVLARLEDNYGVATCEKGDYGYEYQWSYPNVWPPITWLAIHGLDAYGFREEASRIAAKYVRAATETYLETGNLWEKYNVVDGSVSGSNEYETPAMMGWSAGTYLYALSIIEF